MPKTLKYFISQVAQNSKHKPYLLVLCTLVHAAEALADEGPDGLQHGHLPGPALGRRVRHQLHLA